MKKFKVTITETLKMNVEIEAVSQSDAEEIAFEKWNKSEYVLDADHFDGVEFEAEEVSKTKEIREDFNR